MSRSEIAQRVIQAMRSRTPRGWTKPWSSTKNLQLVMELLEQVADEDLSEAESDVLAVLDGALELIAMGRQPVWAWNPANLFGAKTFDRWRADVAQHRQDQERARAAARLSSTAAAVEAADKATNVVPLTSELPLPPEFQRHVDAFQDAIGKRRPTQLALAID